MGDGDACKLVIVVRTDLQIGKGKIAAQVFILSASLTVWSYR